MKYAWPNKKSMLELFQDADVKGTTSVELPSNYEAELFRFALYNFRRRRKYQANEIFKTFQILVDENKLTIFKPIEVEIKKTGT